MNQAFNFAPEAETLVVDLDGTLLRGDMLHESFWSAFSRDWRTPLTALSALARGRAALKRHLAETADIDVSALPYDPVVLARVEAWHASGGRTALVTATDEKLAGAIADYLGTFDEVHGSDGITNLKGRHKARLLEDRFGRGGFTYVGDSRSDLPAWECAAGAITVNAPERLRRSAEGVCQRTDHLDTERPAGIGPHLAALRPHHWLKNALLFVPVMAAHQIDGRTLLLAFLGFCSFNALASSVYVLNDLLDLAADRAHPRKRTRPFASGRIHISHGLWMAALLIALSTALAFVIGTDFLLVLTIYFGLTVAYSLYFKRQIVVDICLLAGLLTTRIIAGGVATALFPSFWLLTFSIFIFLCLAAIKRQTELADMARRGALTASGRGYHVDDLPIVSMIAVSNGYVSVLVMALYLNSDAVVVLYRVPEILWGICVILLYWITRMVMLTHRGAMHDDPLVFAAKDRVSQICAVAIAGLLVLAARM